MILIIEASSKLILIETSLVESLLLLTKSLIESLLLTKSSLIKSTLIEASLVEASLVKASLIEATLIESTLVEASLIEATLVEATLVEASCIEGANTTSIVAIASKVKVGEVGIEVDILLGCLLKVFLLLLSGVFAGKVAEIDEFLLFLAETFVFVVLKINKGKGYVLA